MPALYAPAVKRVISELVAAIQAQALLNGVNVGEVRVGTPNALTILQAESGIYVPDPDNQGVAWPLGKRQPTLVLDVVVHRRSLDSATDSAVLSMTDLVGVVVDAVGENETLSGSCLVARAADVAGAEVETNDAALQVSVVTVEAVVSHNLR